MKLQRMLLPTDFSELSERAADLARPMAQASGATVHVLHVCEPVEIALEVPEIGVLRRKVPPDKTALRRKLEEFARQHVADFGIPAITVLASGKPGRQIARYARDAWIDRIVIGTHAQGIIRQIIHGSVSKFVLEHAPCAVLMVPPKPDQDTELPVPQRAHTPALAESG
jgi:nucleotide-binding universal stress UspA family protein